jgi:hypothetical protein
MEQPTYTHKVTYKVEVLIEVDETDVAPEELPAACQRLVVAALPEDSSPTAWSAIKNKSGKQIGRVAEGPRVTGAVVRDDDGKRLVQIQRPRV